MGNSSSSGKSQNDDTVDFGYLTPQGVYTGPRDWNQSIVTQLICSRRLAPFYRPLEDYDDSWDDDQILAARKELADADGTNLEQGTRSETPNNNTSSRLTAHSKRPSLLKEPSKPEAQVYRGAVECPICFLYYPPNINHSRCCGQAICTECFVQIKRIEPTTTHLVSDPAACPYCVQDNFGIVYKPPPWRAGIGADSSSHSWLDSPRASQIPDSPTSPTHKRRQKSYSADSPEVVTTDHIRPDWEAKLAAVQAAVARRANRRIIMRQVGDRLIPVGITSGRVHALSPEETAASSDPGEGTGSRRSRRRQQPAGNSPFEQFIGLGGQDLEELMVMEAMRLSLLEHEEQQRKEAEAKKKAAVQAATQSLPEAGPSTTSSPNQSSSHGPSSSISSLLTRPLGSRSRSPSPGRQTNSSQSSNSWLGKTPSPPPFSTLNAALAAASTASALIAPSSEALASPPPSITIENSDTSTPPPTTELATSEPFIESHTTNATTSRNNGETANGEPEESG